MSRKARPRPASAPPLKVDNRFEIHISLTAPRGLDMQPLQHWLNIQHEGRPQIPLDEEASRACVEAHHAMHCHYRAIIGAELNRDGTFTPLTLLVAGQRYRIIKEEEETP